MVAKAGALAGKMGEAEGRIIRAGEVGGVIGIPVEAEEGEEWRTKERRWTGQLGREQRWRSETGRSRLWRLKVSSRQWHMVISQFHAHRSSLQVSIDLG